MEPLHEGLIYNIHNKLGVYTALKPAYPLTQVKRRDMMPTWLHTLLCSCLAQAKTL